MEFHEKLTVKKIYFFSIEVIIIMNSSLESFLIAIIFKKNFEFQTNGPTHTSKLLNYCKLLHAIQPTLYTRKTLFIYNNFIVFCSHFFLIY